MNAAGPSSGLRGRAEGLAQALPPLLAEAERLAATVVLGEHGRRRAGTGDEFWQYRAATPSDPARLIDWRRSARSDAHFVREREWQAAQSVTLWVDAGRSMAFSGGRDRPEKGARARLIALALAALLLRGGERVGLAGAERVAPGTGRAQLLHLAEFMAAQPECEHERVDLASLKDGSRAVLLSDFLDDPEPVEAAVSAAAGRGVGGAMVQILDPVEEEFPFGGRTIFESMAGALRHETRQARDLRARYLERLAMRKDRLADLARRTGWQYHSHDTGKPALTALTWAYHALERGR